MNPRMALFAGFLTLHVFGQDLKWTSVPATYTSGTAFDSDHHRVNGEVPLSFKWKETPSEEWSVTIRGIGEPDPYGVSTVSKLIVTSPRNVKSELITPSTDHWLPIYGYVNLGNSHSDITSIAKATIGVWDIWEITIEPVTNGDPPNYRLWVVNHRPSNQVSIQGAVGRGIIAYSYSNQTLDFIFLTQKGDAFSKEGRHFRFQASSGPIKRKEIEPVNVVWNIDAPYPIVIEREVIPGALNCLSWKIIRSDSTGGMAQPDGVLRSTTWKWVSDVTGYVDKYSKYDQPDPPPYAARKSEAITFIWANEISEFPSSTGPWENRKSIDLEKARNLLSTGQWRLLIQNTKDKGFVGFGICKN